MRSYDPSALSEIAFELKNCKAAIIPSDTVMAIVALDPELIYKIKNRSRSKQLITFVSDWSDIEDLNKYELKVLRKYWPGALTIIKNGISYRMPNKKVLLKLLALTGPLYSSSANISGKKEIDNFEQAKQFFGAFNDELILVLDQCHFHQASTIVDFDKKKVLRQGQINGQEIINLLEPKSKK